MYYTSALKVFYLYFKQEFHNNLCYRAFKMFRFRFPSAQKWFASLPDLYLEMGRGGHQDSPKVLELINELIILKQDACREQFTKKLHSYLGKNFHQEVWNSADCSIPINPLVS